MDAKETFVLSPIRKRERERRTKRTRNNDEMSDDGKIWVCETLKVVVIIKKTREFNPEIHSLEDQN